MGELRADGVKGITIPFDSCENEDGGRRELEIIEFDVEESVRVSG